MNFPIYHVENLGNIFGHAKLKNEKVQESVLYSDDRSWPIMVQRMKDQCRWQSFQKVIMTIP